MLGGAAPHTSAHKHQRVVSLAVGGVACEPRARDEAGQFTGRAYADTDRQVDRQIRAMEGKQAGLLRLESGRGQPAYDEIS